MSNVEQELLRRYAEKGDPEAFRELVEYHGDMVFSVCKRLLRNSADAEDAAQTSFLELARHASTLRAPIAGWLHRVAVRVSVNLYRQNRSREFREAFAAQHRPERLAVSWADVCDSLDQALASLPERLRVPIILHYLEGRKQEEIAAQLGISQSSVSKRLTCGIDALRKRLAKSGVLVVAVGLGGLLSANAVEAAPATLSASTGKVVLAATVGVKTAAGDWATIGGISVLKLGIASLAAMGVLAVGGLAVHETMSANTTPIVTAPAAIVPAATPKTTSGLVIAGTVSMPDGKAAVGAEVLLYYFCDDSGFGLQPPTVCKSDNQGRFAFAPAEVTPPRLLLGRPLMKRYLVARKSGYGPAMACVTEGAFENCSLRLSKPATLKCHVFDWRKRSVGGAKITALPSLPDCDPATWPGDDPFWSVETDATGVAVLSDLPMRTIHIRALKDDAAAAVGVDFERLVQLQASGQPEIVINLDEDLVQVRGRVICGDTGKPAAGMLVTTGVQVARTDADGRFEVAERTRRGEQVSGFVMATDPADESAYAPACRFLKDFSEDGNSEIVLQKGVLLSVKAVEKGSDKPLAGAVVQLGFVFSFDPYEGHHISRLANVDGQCSFRFAEKAGALRVQVPPAGYIVKPGTLSANVKAQEGEERQEYLLKVELCREVVADIVAERPDGTPAGFASVWGITNGALPTDDGGYLRVGGIAEGAGLNLYAATADAQYAGCAAFEKLKAGPLSVLKVHLAPARTGTVVVQREGGELFRDPIGAVFVGASGGPTFYWSVRPKVVDGKLVWEVPDLIPGQQYHVTLDRFGPAAGDVQWRCGEHDEHPTITVVLGNTGAAVSVLQARTADNLREDVGALKDIVWQKADPQQANLSWIALREGIVISDTSTNEVRSFKDLLGETDFTATCIAFGKDKVWLGTDKGLFAWDRKDLFWTRFAIGGEIVEASVKALELDAAGNPTATIEDKGRHIATFLYDPARGMWTRRPAGDK